MSVNMIPTSQILIELGLNPGGDVMAFATETCALHMDKYVPFDSGALAGTVVSGGATTGNVQDDTITYNQEYADYVYQGFSTTGKELNYQTDKHPLAGPYWDKRMWTAEQTDVIDEIQRMVDSK